ncbi:hypothetical protein DOTSEDRAFT_71680, partial [Dothistroma septosporum NZE10]
SDSVPGTGHSRRTLLQCEVTTFPSSHAESTARNGSRVTFSERCRDLIYRQRSH